MVTINTVDENYFKLDGISFPRIYEPLKQGSDSIGIYSIYTVGKKIVNSTPYYEFIIDGVVYSSQSLTIEALLKVIWSQVSKASIENLEDRVDNLEENQVTGVVVYSTFAELPATGTLLVSYKVSNDPTASLNGYWHWDGSQYVQDESLDQDTKDNVDKNSYEQIRELTGIDLLNPVATILGSAVSVSNQPYSDGTGVYIAIGNNPSGSYVTVFDKSIEDVNQNLYVMFEVEHPDGLDSKLVNVRVQITDGATNRSVTLTKIQKTSTRSLFYGVITFNVGEISYKGIWQISGYTTTSDDTYKTVMCKEVYYEESDIDGIKSLNKYLDDYLENNIADPTNEESIAKVKTLDERDLQIQFLKKPIMSLLDGAVVKDSFSFVIPTGKQGAGSAVFVPFRVDALQKSALIGKTLRLELLIEATDLDSVTNINANIKVKRGASFVNSLRENYIEYIDGNTTRQIVDYTVTDDDDELQPWFQITNTDAEISDNTITLKDAILRVISEDGLKSRDNQTKSTTYKTRIICDYNGTAGVDCDYAGNLAIRNAIDDISDSSKDKQYEIIVKEGFYSITDEADFILGRDTGTQKCFLRSKPYVSLIGVNPDMVYIHAELPDDLGVDYSLYQTLLWYHEGANIEGVTISCANMRYPIHYDEAEDGAKDFYNKLTNVTLKHLGNTGNATIWQAWNPWGFGSSDGQKIDFIGCNLISKRWALTSHTNARFEKSNIFKFSGCKFISEASDVWGVSAKIEPFGAKTQDTFIFENCSFLGLEMKILESVWALSDLDSLDFDHCKIKILGSGNTPQLYTPALRGGVLKITSLSTGASSTVRFNTSATAFTDIIKNHRVVGDYVDKYNRINTGGYSYKDGADTLSGLALGQLDISEEAIGGAGNVYIKSLGKRLGDCSIVNKYLTLTIDGTERTVTFNKDYVGAGLGDIFTPSDYDNATIIAEINAVISDIAICEEVVSGNDYYPEFSDVMVYELNRSASAIKQGRCVKKYYANGVQLSSSGDSDFYAIALDDVAPNEYGRFLKKGYLKTSSSNRFFAKILNDVTVNQGDTFGIGSGAELEKSATPIVCEAVQNSVIVFNL